MSDEGNFEGHNILNRLKTHLPRSREGSEGEADEARLSSLRAILLEARAGRVRPGLDDKVLADWNGLMIAALVNAGVALEEPAWLDMARRAFAFIAASDDRRRPPRPFVARGPAAAAGIGVGLRRHDPRRARAL